MVGGETLLITLITGMLLGSLIVCSVKCNQVYRVRNLSRVLEHFWRFLIKRFTKAPVNQEFKYIGQLVRSQEYRAIPSYIYFCRTLPIILLIFYFNLKGFIVIFLGTLHHYPRESIGLTKFQFFMWPSLISNTIIK